MRLSEAIDALIAEAELQQANPFRLELQSAEIEELRGAGSLEARPENDSYSGIYRSIKVYPATRASELFAQPADALLAIHLLVPPSS